ncbi:MAG: UDP-N-acetylmuramoyl-L-alanine--D-glutamate ligase [bacterium]
MQNLKEQFKGKKITVMGLGLLGRGVGDTAYLAECGADLIVTDLKSKEQLASSLKILKKFPNIKFVLGEHRLEDFQNRDMVLKAAGVPLDSIYIKEARENNIPVEMSASLFAKIAGIKIVGITGTRGKSTVTHLIAQILKLAGKKILLGGNVRGVSTLQLLKKVTPKTIAVFELDSWQLQGFGDSRISPNISIFTTFLDDHLNYYKGNRDLYFSDKANIFKYQNRSLPAGRQGDIFVVGEGVVKQLPGEVKRKVQIARAKDFPKNWKLKIPGEHNKMNAMCAILAARGMGINERIIKKAVENFSGIEGRLQFVREIKGVKIYNDNNSTTPDATIAALKAVGDIKKRNIVLIIGGDDKKLDTKKLLQEMPKWCSKIVMFKERGTDTIRDEVLKFKKKGIEVYEEEGLENTVKRAYSVAKKGETILYSPGFSSFGKYFKNEYDRNDQFIKIVKGLK